jgi:hypothetical protein
MDLDVLGIGAFEGAIAGLLKENQDGEDLRWVQPCCTSAATMSGGEQLSLPQGFKVLPECIPRTIPVEYAHGDTCRSG